MGLSLARQFQPAAISLDIFLPDMLGWTVLNQLKLDPATRHIPVQIVTLEEERQHGLAHGAFAYLVKEPTTDGLEAAFDRIKDFTAPRTKRLLVVEDNDIERQSIVELLGYDDIEIGDGRHRRRGAGGDARPAVRLRRARPAPAGHDRLRAAGEDARRAGAGRRAGRRLHRQGPDRRRAGAAQDDGQEHRPQGRAVARAAARRDGAVPAPRGHRPAGREAGRCWSGCTAPTKCCAAARCWWSTTTRATSSP